MSGGYFTVNDFERTEVIKHSRFTAILRTVRTEEDAIALLDKIRSENSDATHVCYAYRIGDRAERVRFSDAGEPQGTAGKPILEALTLASATYSLAAVARWFGGVKLGAGGLTRAYSGAVSAALAEGGLKEYTLCERAEIVCSLSQYGVLARIAQNGGAIVTEREFADRARLVIARGGEMESLIGALKNASGGDVKIERLEKSYMALGESK